MSTAHPARFMPPLLPDLTAAPIKFAYNNSIGAGRTGQIPILQRSGGSYHGYCWPIVRYSLNNIVLWRAAPERGGHIVISGYSGRDSVQWK